MKYYVRSTETLSAGFTLDLSWLWRDRVSSASRSYLSPKKKSALRRNTGTLEDLPMKHSVTESRNQMATQRSHRCQTAVSVQSTTEDSVTQRNLGKRLFDEAVDRATTPGSVEPSLGGKSPRSLPSLSTTGTKMTPSYVTAHKRQKHNGPTKAGSPLYNRTELELFTIRSESSVSKNDCSISVSNTELKRQIERISTEYHVVPNNGNSNYSLIPLYTDATKSAENGPAMSRNMMEGFHYKKNYKQNRAKQSNHLLGDLMSTGSDMVISESGESQNNQASEVSVQNIIKTKTGRTILETKANALKDQSVSQKQNGLLSVQREGVRPSSACSERSSRSGGRSPSRGRPCWVDDASVVSSRQDRGEGGQEDGGPCSNPGPTMNQTVLDGVNNLRLHSPLNGDTKRESHNPTVMSLKDLQQKNLSLPDFICPSSEDKSRQAAVREWIENSSFPWASRTVPLL